MWTGSQIRDIVDGELHEGANRQCTGVSTDTRTLQVGDLFVALAGEHFDGHDFLNRAMQQGCCGCLVQSDIRGVMSGLVHVAVPDTLKALGELASAHLQAMPAPVIAVTGSNGKTGTKELIACALSAYGQVARNPGNFNNLIGLPLAAFQVTPQDDYVVLEMGMNSPGEIARLADIAKPSVGVVTSVARAHLDGLGSIEDVARAKGELYRALGLDDVAIVNARDSWVASAAIGTHAKVVTVADRNANVVCESIRRTGVAGLSADLRIGDQKYEINLRSLARHDLWNATLAIAVVHALGLDPAPGIRALEHYEGPAGRLQWRVTKSGINIIDDSYNANPASAKAALNTLAEVGAGARRIAVLGDMLELGPTAASLHHETGQYAADLDIDRLYAAGDHAADLAAGFAAENLTVQSDHSAGLIGPLKDDLRSGDWVLVKGSRGMRMENVVEALLEIGEER